MQLAQSVSPRSLRTDGGMPWNMLNVIFCYRRINLVCVSFPLVYHYLAAVRHVAWDYVPDYLENADVQKSSYALFGAATVISAGTMFL